MTRKIGLIVIHCADSPNGHPFTAQDIDSWHRERGFERMPQWRARQNPNLTSIGYHFVIGAQGALETGRHSDEIGAHVQGHNANSLGICLIGRDQFSLEQWNQLGSLVEQLQIQYPQARVVGHRSLSLVKTCPNFDVQAWLQADLLPPVDQIYPQGGQEPLRGKPTSGAVS